MLFKFYISVYVYFKFRLIFFFFHDSSIFVIKIKNAKSDVIKFLSPCIVRKIERFFVLLHYMPDEERNFESVKTLIYATRAELLVI